MNEIVPTMVLSDLTVGYFDGKLEHRVVNMIDASLYGGELVSLIGSNGAGKSTLLRTISAFQFPLSGSINYNGICRDVTNASQLSQHVAIVLTERNSIYNLSVREVVAMGRMPYTGFWGGESDYDNVVIDNALLMLGVNSIANRMVETLSDGERQKVMIAKALAQETPIILLDEPTAYLDFRSRVNLMQLLRDLAHECNKAVLLSTHDLELALQLSDKLWLIDKGRMYTGSVSELSVNGTLSSFIDGDGMFYDVRDKKIKII